jgi:hypothetical protein
MSKTLTAVFDGDVLRPDSPLDLKPNTRYVITIQLVAQPGEEDNALLPLSRSLVVSSAFWSESLLLSIGFAVSSLWANFVEVSLQAFAGLRPKWSA